MSGDRKRLLERGASKQSVVLGWGVLDYDPLLLEIFALQARWNTSGCAEMFSTSNVFKSKMDKIPSISLLPQRKKLCKNVYREYSVHHSSICRKIVENPIFWLPIIFYNSKIASLKDIMKFACKNSKHALVAIELGFRYLHLRKRKFSQIMIYDTKIVFTYYTMKWMQFVCMYSQIWTEDFYGSL